MDLSLAFRDFPILYPHRQFFGKDKGIVNKGISPGRIPGHTVMAVIKIEPGIRVLDLQGQVKSIFNGMA